VTPPLPILLDDGPLLAFDKPCGVSSIPARGEPPGASLLELASAREGGKLFVVHRLDKDTSGVILFARTAAAHRRLSGLFEDRQTEKTYLAWVQGILRDAGAVDVRLREFGSGRVAPDPAGKACVTRWRAVRGNGDRTLLEVRPETGRRHQIRAHLHSIGHPVLGDRLYGNPRPVGGAPRLMLHAASLAFPWDGPEPVRVSAPVPADFFH
jgi:RluA family pseudouridine synthase